MTSREIFLLRVLAVVGAAAFVVVIGYFIVAQVTQIDREIAAVQKQLANISRRDAEESEKGSISEQIVALTEKKKEIESHLFQKNELSIYDFAQRIRAGINSQNLAIQQLSIDPKNNEVLCTSVGQLSDILRFMRDLQTGNKYFTVRYLAIQRVRNSECSMQVRVGYAEAPF